MIQQYYRFQQGESIIIPLDADGDISTVEAIDGRMRKTPRRPISANYATTISGEFEFIPLTVGNGWLMTLVDSMDVVPGWHVADAQIFIDGKIYITEPIGIEIVASVSGAPE